MTVLRRNILGVYIPVRAEDSLRVSVKIQKQLQKQEVLLQQWVKEAHRIQFKNPRTKVIK